MWTLDAVFKALSLSMLDSVWQMGFFWILYLLLTQLFVVTKPGTSFAVGFVFSVLGFLSWGISFYNYLNSIPYSLLTFEKEFFLNKDWSAQHAFLFRMFSTLYLAGISFLSLRFFVRYYQVHQLLQATATPPPAALTAFVQRKITQLGISRTVQVKISKRTQVPFTYGFWKPVILFPLAALNHLDLQETEAILLHELEHIRRKDYLLNYWILVLDLVFFFNPFSRAFTVALRQTREECCDDQVLKNDYPAWQYASALLKLAQKENSPSPKWVLAALSQSSLHLQKRIERFIRPTATPVIPLPIEQWLLAFGLLIALYFLQPIQINQHLVTKAEVKTMGTPINSHAAITGSKPLRNTKTNSYLIHARKKRNNLEIAQENRPYIAAVTVSNTPLASKDDFEKIRTLYTNIQVSEKRDFTYAETTPPTPVNAQHQFTEDWNQPYVPKNSFLHGEITESMKDSISRQITPQQWKALCYQLLLYGDQAQHYSSSHIDLDSLYKLVEEKIRKKIKQEVQPQKGNQKVIRL